MEQNNREQGDEQRELQRQLRDRRKDSLEERKRAGDEVRMLHEKLQKLTQQQGTGIANDGGGATQHAELATNQLEPAAAALLARPTSFLS